jgi:hypothetical protein
MLFLRWTAACLMIASIINLIYGIIAGHQASIIVSAIALPVNAITAEFWRRRLDKEIPQ